MVWPRQFGDVDEIIESHIVGGRPVERLIIPDSLLNAFRPTEKAL